jgi:replicative DNA helicase
MGNENFSLPIKHISVAVQEADKEIQEGLSPNQNVLFTRWPKLNYALLGGFRPANQYIVGGASGSGKSFFLNMLRQDFTNPLLNGNFKKKFKILHFGLEMTSADEVLRDYSQVTKKSYRDLLSVDTPIDPGTLIRLESYKTTLREKQIFFVEESGTVNQILTTIENFQAKFPDCFLVISFDHTLLADFEGEKDEVALVSKLSKGLLLKRKKINSLNIIIAQLNDKIEQVERINNSSLHYPTKTDLHGSKSVYRDADVVMILHAPEHLGIDAYGKHNFPTEDLIACHIIKVRKGNPYMIRFKNKLGEGTLEEWKD